MGETLCSSIDMAMVPFNWDDRWGSPMDTRLIEGANYGGDASTPNKDTFRQCRRWARMNRLVGNILTLRRGFFNYGLLGERKVLSNPKKPKDGFDVELHPGIQAVAAKDKPKLDKWKADRYADIASYFRSGWNELLVVDIVITIWAKGGQPLVQNVEKCEYSDVFGDEVVTIRHNLSAQQIDEMAIPPAQKTRLKQSKELKIRKGDPLYSFDVVKRTPRGHGVGWPGIGGIFHSCAIIENLQTSDRQLSDAMRTVYEQHLCGYEIKNGPGQGSSAQHLKPVRATAVGKMIKAKKGHIQIVTNFDHKIVIGAGLPAPTQFDDRRFLGALNDIMLWGMPFGQMVLAKAINPYLMPLLSQMATDERELMRPHFKRILKEALGCPVDFTLEWDNSIFWDSRLMLDLLKTALNAGPLSQETFLTTAGFNHSQELGRKGNEADLDDGYKSPAWDPNHGKRPGDDKGGKPPGGRDRT